MKEIKLPSGAELKIGLAPFSDSKALYQSVLEEAKSLRLDPAAEVDVNLFKDLFCAGLSSKKIEMSLKECLKKCLYNGLKIDPDKTFEPVEAREDYFQVCFEVAQENIAPFTKNLLQQYSAIFQKLKTVQA